MSTTRKVLEEQPELIIAALEGCLRGHEVLMDPSRIDEIAPYFASQIPGGSREDWINELKEDIRTFNPSHELEEEAFANAVHFEQEFGLLPPEYDFHAALEFWTLEQATARVKGKSR